MKTYVTKPAEVERTWYVVDANDKILGRLAVKVANVLRGKNKPTFQPNVDTGDHVIVINADKIRMTGTKEDTKTYFRASTQPGHSKSIPYKSMKENHPERIVELAIKGMLPHNALGRQIYRKLHVYAGPKHNQSAQMPEVYEV